MITDSLCYTVVPAVQLLIYTFAKDLFRSEHCDSKFLLLLSYIRENENITFYYLPHEHTFVFVYIV